MADVRNGDPTGVGPSRLEEIITAVLTVADLVLRLFGRRKSDRPRRDAEPTEER